MNTKNLPREERKKAKRVARKKQPPKPKSTADRGSQKRKMKKKGPGDPKRR
ncbi:MAG: hypothetical protein NTZ98_06905 [Acidobacteria bacterium]|jgi:hypothetical protein|nr:hypothetical protein [Acidobacteriota bacterium]